MNTSYISKGGLYTALGVLLIYLSSILPTNKLFILGAASCIIPIAIVTTNIKFSMLVYAATFLLSAFISSSKLMPLFYLLFFGSYGFTKYYVEKLRKLPLEFFIKLLFFNGSILVMYLLYKTFFTGALKLNFSLALLAIAGQIAFIVYDYALTLFIHNFANRFLHK